MSRPSLAEAHASRNQAGTATERDDTVGDARTHLLQVSQYSGSNQVWCFSTDRTWVSHLTMAVSANTTCNPWSHKRAHSEEPLSLLTPSDVCAIQALRPRAKSVGRHPTRPAALTARTSKRPLGGAEKPDSHRHTVCRPTGATAFQMLWRIHEWWEIYQLYHNRRGRVPPRPPAGVIHPPPFPTGRSSAPASTYSGLCRRYSPYPAPEFGPANDSASDDLVLDDPSMDAYTYHAPLEGESTDVELSDSPPTHTTAAPESATPPILLFEAEHTPPRPYALPEPEAEPPVNESHTRVLFRMQWIAPRNRLPAHTPWDG